MNAKQRRRSVREKALLQIGQEAEEKIAAMRAELAAAEERARDTLVAIEKRACNALAAAEERTRQVAIDLTLARTQCSDLAGTLADREWQLEAAKRELEGARQELADSEERRKEHIASLIQQAREIATLRGRVRELEAEIKIVTSDERITRREARVIAFEVTKRLRRRLQARMDELSRLRARYSRDRRPVEEVGLA